ncbi:MAG: DNA-directed RNA polymerase subunit alpha [Elusimicrobia bacterium]|nr:DNA-directed RNA polymerase subunit alpha [Elusimicrobiota bacterium]
MPNTFVKDIVIPSEIKLEEKTSTQNYGKFTAEPYEKGFGHTVGNSFRRTLLSQIDGAAVVAVRIKGVTHEYSVLDGVKEDVINIILNLKKLRLKVNSEDERITLFISQKGKKSVTAADIKENSSVEIVNKDLHIATLEAGAVLEAELEVAKGVGYMTSDEIRKALTLPQDFIPVDALFSPVTKVNYTVENARVGQKTDYDKLILEVWTDGSISPKEAVEKSGNLISQSLTPFLGEPKPKTGKQETVHTSENEEDQELKELLESGVDIIELSSRAANCLKVANIQTIGELVSKTEQELLAVKNFGQKSLDEIKEKLEELGLSLGMTKK